MFNSWEVEAAVVTSWGGSARAPTWENDCAELASVWRTCAHQRWMMALPAAFRHRIDQYLYGSVGVKPTCLRALNLGDPSLVEAAMCDGEETWRIRPRTKLMGRNERGEFRTASAKEYAIALCRSIIKTLRQRAHTEGLREPTVISTTDAQWLQNALSASAQCSSGSYLPDYQGS